MDSVWVGRLIIIVCSVLGSGGLWAYLQSRDTKRSAEIRLMMGLAYAELTRRGQEYIDRGYVTKDEFEDYQKYFFTPYKELGGNGVAERYMNGVSQLPMRRHYDFRMSPPNEEYTHDVRIVTPARQGSAE